MKREIETKTSMAINVMQSTIKQTWIQKIESLVKFHKYITRPVYYNFSGFLLGCPPHVQDGLLDWISMN